MALLLGINYTHMCVIKREEYGSLFQLQVNEMNDKMSFKMGMKFAVPLYIGRILRIFYETGGKST